MAVSQGIALHAFATRPANPHRQLCFKQGAGHPPRVAAPSKRGSFQTSAQERFSTQLIGGLGGSANQLFVAGADGQLGARICQKLLQAGFKVTAGVADGTQARSVVDFATSVELLKKQEAQRLQLAEVDLADEDSIAAALPTRGARVVAVVGDGAGKAAKLDLRAATRVLLAAQKANASQFVLVAPVGSAGFLASLFGGGIGGGSGSGSPSKLEQDLAASGLDFIVIRTGRTDVQDSEFEAANNVAVGTQGALPSQARITKNQVAEVVQQVIRQADTDVLIEAWASPDAAAVSVEEAILKVLPEAAIEDEEEEENSPLAQAASEESEEVEVPKTPGGLFAGFGTRKVKLGGDAPDSAEPARAAAGTRRIGRRGQTQQPQNGASPAGAPRRPSFGFGRKQAAAEEEEAEEEDASYNPAEALRGLFGSAKKNDRQAQVTPENARNSAAQGIKSVGRAAKQAAPFPRGRRSRPGAQEEKPRKPGFLASIGLSSESAYVDNDDN